MIKFFKNHTEIETFEAIEEVKFPQEYNDGVFLS